MKFFKKIFLLFLFTNLVFGEEDNVEVYKWGGIKKMTFDPKQHFNVPAASDIDFKGFKDLLAMVQGVLAGMSTLAWAVVLFFLLLLSFNVL